MGIEVEETIPAVAGKDGRKQILIGVKIPDALD
jgi:hypothetical protein